VQTADHVAQSGGGQLLDGAQVVGDLVGRGTRIRHLEVHDGVDRDDEVVFGDDRLRWEGDELFAHIHQGAHPVDEWHQDVQSGGEGAVVAAKPLDDARVGLRNDADGSCENDENKDAQHHQQGDHKDLTDEGSRIKQTHDSFLSAGT